MIREGIYQSEILPVVTASKIRHWRKTILGGDKQRHSTDQERLRNLQQKINKERALLEKLKAKRRKRRLKDEQ